MAVWFPDWPPHAAGVMAVTQDHRVRACTASARGKGVKRGMRVREAQALFPQLTIAEWDEDRDAREFEVVVYGLGEVAASVEVLRPGLALIDAGAAGRFYGSEARAVQLLADAAALKGVDCMVGVADDIATAVIAARIGAVVAPEGSQAFLANQPLALLMAEEALHCDADTVRAFRTLGIRVLGELAALPTSAVVTRFGRAGLRCQRIAQAREDRKVAPELPTSELRVELTPEEPITRVDEAAFLARTLAVTLHGKLQRAGVICQRLKVIAVADTELARVWRTREPLTESATADRVRWQLDGWLTSRQIPEITTLALEPLEVSVPVHDQGLWGASDDKAAQARRVINRVQSLLGTDAVLQPRATGGRGATEQVELVPYGEEVPERRQAGPWLGALPSPLPARAASHPASAIQLVDAAGDPVFVRADAVLSGDPVWAVQGARRCAVLGWAGPWPIDDRWWEPDAAQKYARLQLVVDQAGAQRAFLLVWLAGRWRIEASYD
ncbi:DNA polymerase Y family protein [Corynebacterium sp. H128]|uniref:Y-family DNA polymerase n=1 Tax=unclassified Corynebacterium TaxID=2624378 RepID=UPI0030A2B8D1